MKSSLPSMASSIFPVSPYFLPLSVLGKKKEELNGVLGNSW